MALPLTGKLLAVSVAQPEALSFRGVKALSSINKQPVSGPVMVRRHNIDGDRQADLEVHGGPDKAVYCYASEHYASWREELGRSLEFGAFGENLTLAGLTEDRLHIGDIITVGDALLQVSQPRFPCYKLGIKMGSQRFVRRFQASGRSGFYCRVLAEGLIEAGQTIEVVEQDPAQPTIASIVAGMNTHYGIKAARSPAPGPKP